NIEPTRQAAAQEQAEAIDIIDCPSSEGRNQGRLPLRRVVLRRRAACLESVDDVVASVDIERLARDQLRCIRREKGGGDAELVDRNKAARGRFLLCLLEEPVELAYAGGRTRLQRPRRYSVHADPFGPKFGSHVARGRLEGRLHGSHHVVV